MKTTEQIDIFDDEQQRLIQEQEVFKTLFKNCVFFLNREVLTLLFLFFKSFELLFLVSHLFFISQVPRESLEFVILSFGGEVILDEKQEADKRITHQVVDNDYQKHR
jgi:hypothetical protein